MVAHQESSRPLLDAAEICKLPATDAIILVAGFPPFKAKRLKYYADPRRRRATVCAADCVTRSQFLGNHVKRAAHKHEMSKFPYIVATSLWLVCS
jgi:type IV secretory pathway TraG/TraD family ATPase VirD4